VGKAGGGEYTMLLCNGTLFVMSVGIGDVLTTGCVRPGSITLGSGVQGDITQLSQCGNQCNP